MSRPPSNVTQTTRTEPSPLLTPRIGEFANQLGRDFNRQAGFDQLGGQGLELIPGAQGLVNRTIAGDFLTPDSNPFLQQTFNRAADLTRTRLGSEFAGAGRNVSASLPARSEELQTLASNIFGTNFQRERDRQIAALGQAPALDPTNIGIDRIAALAPAAGGTALSSTPVSRNVAGGVLGGAALGSAFGPFGTIIGGGLGGIFG